MAGKNFTDFALQDPIQDNDYIVGYQSSGIAELRTPVSSILNKINLTNVSNASGSWNNTHTTTNTNSGRWENAYTAVNSLSAKAGVYMPLSFSSLNNYDVPGDGVIRNLGDTAGMTITFNPETTFCSGLAQSEDDTNWYFEVQLQLAAQYGGVTIDTGINLDYSTSASVGGSFNTDIILPATRTSESGTNFEVHYRRFNFFVPKVFNSSPVNYIRLNVIARRPSFFPGNTGIISGFIKFLTN